MNSGGSDGGIVEIKRYDIWLYLGALGCDGNVIDYSDETGNESAFKNESVLRAKLQSHGLLRCAQVFDMLETEGSCLKISNGVFCLPWYGP